jgi:hypothetical protein
MEALFRRYREDPVAFCHDMFPPEERPRDEQSEVLAGVWANKQSLITAHRGWGKSRTAAYALLSFLVPRPNSLVMTLAPVWEQVTSGVWVDVRHLWSISKLPRIFPSWSVLTHQVQTHPLTPKWRAVGVAASEVQNIESKHAAKDCPAMVIGDECKQIGDLFRASVDGMLKLPESRFFGIGTPGIPRGWFYEGFSKHRDAYWTRRFRGDESSDPNVRALVAAKMAIDPNDPFFRQQWLAEFTGADDGSVLPLDSVERAIGKRMEAHSSWVKIAALDVAGESVGGDENVLTLRHGPVVIKQISWGGQDEMQTAARAVSEAVKFGAVVLVIDEVGIGAGVRSRCRELAPESLKVFGFSGGRAARDNEQYANIKAEEAFILRRRFADGQISIPDDPELIGQLTSWTQKFTETGKVKIVDPTDSPDKADSLLMAFAADRLGQAVKGVTPRFLR